MAENTFSRNSAIENPTIFFASMNVVITDIRERIARLIITQSFLVRV
jgi:hypothetical protein